MGYYVTMIGGEFYIPGERAGEAVEAFESLHPDVSIGDSSKTDKERLSDILDGLGFQTDYTSDGDILVYGFDGKWRDHIQQFLAAFAPIMPDGSSLWFRGEDGDYFRFVTLNGRLIEYTGGIVWELVPDSTAY